VSLAFAVGLTDHFIHLFLMIPVNLEAF